MTVQPKGKNVAIGDRTFVTGSNRERILGYKWGMGTGTQERRLGVDYPKLRIYEDTV